MSTKFKVGDLIEFALHTKDCVSVSYSVKEVNLDKKCYVCRTCNQFGELDDCEIPFALEHQFIKLEPVFLEKTDKVNSPSHYKWFYNKFGVEPADVAAELGYNLGNAFTYCVRSGRKSEEGYTDLQKQIEDLKKAIWHINKEIERLEGVN